MKTKTQYAIQIKTPSDKIWRTLSTDAFNCRTSNFEYARKRFELFVADYPCNQYRLIHATGKPAPLAAVGRRDTGNIKATELLVGRNLVGARMQIDKYHVGTSYLTIIRDLRKRIRSNGDIPKAILRGLTVAIMERHCENRETYELVMSPVQFKTWRFDSTNGWNR